MKRITSFLAALALACAWISSGVVPAHAATGGQVQNGRQQFIDQNGYPIVGGSVYTYNVGTTTPVTTYQDSGLTTPNTSPLVLDSKGQASIWVAPGLYRQVVYDGLGNLIWDQTTSSIGTAASQLSTPRTISATGDGAWSVSFDGSANVTSALTLAASGATAGTYGDATHTNTLAVDAKGRITSISSNLIPTMVGDSGAGGTKGLVPAPATGDAAAGKYLKADGTWTALATPTVAWANVAVSGGVASINKQLNVGAVSRTSAGHFTITFTSNIADSNYAVLFGTTGVSGSTNSMSCDVVSGSKAINSFQAQCQISNGAQGSGTDPSELSFSVLD